MCATASRTLYQRGRHFLNKLDMFVNASAANRQRGAADGRLVRQSDGGGVDMFGRRRKAGDGRRASDIVK